MAGKKSPAPYSEDQAALAPPWLQKLVGEEFLSAQGFLKDAFAEGVIQGIKTRWLATAKPDALRYIGGERNLEQLPTEDDNAYRARLLNAWTAWSQAGTRLGVLNNLKLLGFTNVQVIENSEWSQAPSPGFAAGAEWWRFWVIIRLPHPFGSPPIVGSFSVGSGATIGASAPIGLTDAIRRTVRKWKPAHAICVSVTVVLSGSLVGDAGLTVGGFTAGGTSINIPV